MAKTVSNSLVFTGNPVWLNMTGSGQRRFLLYGPDYGSVDGYEPLYEGIVTAPAVVDIAELLASNVPLTPDPGEGGEDVLIALQEFTTVVFGENMTARRSPNSVTVKYMDSDDTLLFVQSFQAFVGGVSKQNWRKLLDWNTDIFAQRFLRKGCNMFMTTRSADWKFSIKETEMYPLCFFYPSSGTLKVREQLCNNELEVEGTAGMLCALDLAAVRRHFFTTYGIITNVLDVYTDDTFDCRIAIEEAVPAPERYRLKFRNSYGVFEVVQLVGTATITPTQESERDYTEYDEDVDDFVSARGREPMSVVLDVESGPKRRDEMRLLLDAVNSDEVYLLDAAHDAIKVIPTVEDGSWRVLPDGLQSLTLHLQVCDDEGAVMQELVNENDGSRHIFTDEYTDQYT